jgi:SAM-dependent methyltransferase
MDPLLEATYRAERDHFWFRGFRRFITPLLDRAARGRRDLEILDCGSGTGANMQRLAHYGRVTGFDLSWDGLRFAREYQQRRLVRASAVDIPFASAAFDLVTVFDMLVCLDESRQRRALAEMHRVLRPDGAFVVNTAALPFLHGQHSVLSSEVRRLRRHELAAMLRETGFRVERLTYTNLSLLPIIVPVRAWQRLRGLAPSDHSGPDIEVPAAPVNAALAAVLSLEAAAVKRVNMPLGSSLMALAWKRSNVERRTSNAERQASPTLSH